MLKSLTVKNFTIIEEANLEFNSGMSTITGETGTGKSILIGALGLALGQRAQAQHLSQSDGLMLTLEIDLDDSSKTQDWLEEAGLASDNECILRRTVTRDGRSRAFINDTQVSLAQLRTLGKQLVEIVGQNTQQSLMLAERQLAIVDTQCEHGKDLGNMQDMYEQWVAVSKKIQRHLEKDDDIKARTALLEYQIEELQQFSPQDSEFSEIEQSYKYLSKKEALQQEIYRALVLLEENESHDATSSISEAVRIFNPISDADAGIATAVEQLEIALNHIQIASQETRDCLEQLDVNEEQYRELEKRLQSYLDLSRKYNVPPAELHALYQKLQTQLEEIKSPGASIEELQRHQAELKAGYSTFADKISKRRRNAAAKLSKQITQTLRQLNMQSAEFEVSLKPREDDKPERHGNEQIEFFIRTNLGHPSAPLSKIASGGELSRVSLALQAASAKNSQTPTLIFDEVDSGVGGKTAEMVGKLLKSISRGAQVLCVTHLPQIAAQVDHHFVVDKQQRTQNVCVTVKKLSMTQRQREIARMAAGSDITEKSLAHAAEMLNTASNAATS